MARVAPATVLGSVWPRFPLATPSQRIGLLGGSFNPAHDGHRQITLEALARLDLDAVWWLVTPGNPLKDHSGLAPLDTRMVEAVQLANHPRIVITGVEAALGTRFTAETLARIMARHPSVNFVWLMGADNLAQFHRWKNWQNILSHMPVAVLDRPGWRLKALAAPAAGLFSRCRLPERQALSLPLVAAPAWVYLSNPLSPLSSTALRARRSKLKAASG